MTSVASGIRGSQVAVERGGGAPGRGGGDRLRLANSWQRGACLQGEGVLRCSCHTCALKWLAVCHARRKPDGTMLWSHSGQYSRHREYPWNLPSMQIYASYKWRRDFINGIKSAGSLTRTRSLKACPRPFPCACGFQGRRRASLVWCSALSLRSGCPFAPASSLLCAAPAGTGACVAASPPDPALPVVLRQS